MCPKITEIETVSFTYPVDDASMDPTAGKLVYSPGETHEREVHGVRIITDMRLRGEYIGATGVGLAQIDLCAEYLLGRDPLKREKHWDAMRQILRKYDQMGLGPVDIALWDLAGKHYGAPIHELLGTYRERLPAYASTYFAERERGLDSPEAFADFAETCLDHGYPAFKTHTWTGEGPSDVRQEVELIRTVGERVGDRMRLMHDPVCSYETFGDAVTVGRACDEYDYFWYEDPLKDGGRSQHAHQRLGERINTPLLQTELVRGLEPTVDFLNAGATDFARADPDWDGGITGAMKIARAAEGHGLDVEYHLAGPAQRHCMAATRNSNYYELGLVHPDSPLPHTESPVYQGGYTDRIDSIDSDGTVGVPGGPGLGVDYDWEYVRENQVNSTVYN
jgi:L-alanine-DL-glutamate epimerase-like enolase superfamily enzyme